MWDLSSQISNRTVLTALEAKVSAWDSQGGPSPSPCPGVSGLSRFTPLPSTVHPPRILSRVSTPPVPSVPRRNHRDAASSSCSVTCPKLLLRSPLSCACPLPLPLSQPRSVLLFPEHPQGLGARRLTPTSPILQTRGRSGAECVPLGGHGAIACGVRSRCPSPALSDPLTTRRKAPNSAPGGARARDRLLIPGCQQGHRGLGDCPMQARPCQSALGAKNQNIKQKEYCDKLIKRWSTSRLKKKKA